MRRLITVLAVVLAFLAGHLFRPADSSIEAQIIKTTPGGTGGGAPTTATYWLAMPDGALGSAYDLLALGVDSLVLQGAGVPAAYGGAACTDQVIEDLNAVGAPSCVTVYRTVEDEGTPLTVRSTINFTGTPITCSDSGGKTVCNITGGGSGLDHQQVMVRVGMGY